MDHAEPTPNDAEALLDRAKALRTVLQSQARRAFVLELTGTPKAGKSSSVASLQTFFREAGFQVHLLRERAADCPLPMKGHFFFNAWTTATMLAEVLETYETNVDLLILDRGFFDALIWLELQTQRGQVTEEEKRVFSEFVLLERWRSLVDTTVIMTVDPERALQREHKDQIVHRTGSMMNPTALAQFNGALSQVASEHAARFDLITLDTTAAKSVVDTNIELLGRLLPRIEQWADPEIAVVPKDLLAQIFAGQPYLHVDESTTALMKLLEHVVFRRRSAAEQSDDVVQFIAAGIHTHARRGVVLFEREAVDKKAADYGRRTLWLGCHVERENGDLVDLAKRCLVRRIQQDLHLATPPRLAFLGLAWDQSQKESQHVGIMFRAPLDSDDVAKHLENKQFKKMARSRRLRSLFMTQEDIVKRLPDLDLEPWSRHIAKNIQLIPTPHQEPTP